MDRGCNSCKNKRGCTYTESVYGVCKCEIDDRAYEPTPKAWKKIEAELNIENRKDEK